MIGRCGGASVAFPKHAQIVIFTNGTGYLVARVDDVLSLPADDRWELDVAWEVRTG